MQYKYAIGAQIQRTRPGGSAPGQALRGHKPIANLHTLADVAELLSVSTRTVRRLIDDGHLPCHRIGRSIRISETDLRSYLASAR